MTWYHMNSVHLLHNWCRQPLAVLPHNFVIRENNVRLDLGAFVNHSHLTDLTSLQNMGSEWVWESKDIKMHTPLLLCPYDLATRLQSKKWRGHVTCSRLCMCSEDCATCPRFQQRKCWCSGQHVLLSSRRWRTRYLKSMLAACPLTFWRLTADWRRHLRERWECRDLLRGR